ncbi:MAG: hypothetical protein GYA55_09515 [SAR324 cluster bacterium]|uniref:Cyanovirin-N domain-containing protein n=1 Tax=SAR324 cluster bacterium TaxID=2024889 RepID=A0A7X9IJS4_9DELT|nr:hypothetical protein [SAR324 cluster bacterium]
MRIYRLLPFLLILFISQTSDAFALKFPPARCKEFKGSIFKPCICPKHVPKTIKYRPSLAVCGGNAAAILSGAYGNSFSVVLRDSQNNDRVPAVGFNGCTKEEADLGLARCSAFKCQKTIRSGGKYICCFGDSGTSRTLSSATRMTIKLRDDPTSGNDPLIRVCLPGFDPDKKLN